MNNDNLQTVILFGLGLIALGVSQWKHGYRVAPMYIGIYIPVVIVAWTLLYFSGPDESGARGFLEMMITFGGLILVFVFSFIEMIVLLIKSRK